jgi:hypothetical protein
MGALPGTVQARDNAAQEVDGARQQRDFAAESLRRIGLRVPRIIEGVVDPESGLLDDLDKVYAFRPESFDKIVRRAQALAPVWEAADTWLDDRTPPLPPVVAGTLTHAAFVTLLNGFDERELEVARQDEAFSAARNKVGRDARALETLCIRFLKAASGLADPGSAAEAALATIPTQSASNLPDVLGIRTFSQGGQDGLQLLVAYSPYALAPGETAVLQYQRLDVDPDWLETPYDASGNAIGPFEAGQTVVVRTRVTNASGSREGGKRQLTLLTLPQVV